MIAFFVESGFSVPGPVDSVQDFTPFAPVWVNVLKKIWPKLGPHASSGRNNTDIMHEISSSTQWWYSPRSKTGKKINNEGKTILVVTHEHDIAKMCKRIVHLRDGVIVEDKKIKQNILKNV